MPKKIQVLLLSECLFLRIPRNLFHAEILQKYFMYIKVNSNTTISLFNKIPYLILKLSRTPVNNSPFLGHTFRDAFKLENSKKYAEISM